MDFLQLTHRAPHGCSSASEIWRRQSYLAVIYEAVVVIGGKCSDRRLRKARLSAFARDKILVKIICSFCRKFNRIKIFNIQSTFVNQIYSPNVCVFLYRIVRLFMIRFFILAVARLVFSALLPLTIYFSRCIFIWISEINYYPIIFLA